jgi:hypothetical protein
LVSLPVDQSALCACRRNECSRCKPWDEFRSGDGPGVPVRARFLNGGPRLEAGSPSTAQPRRSHSFAREFHGRAPFSFLARDFILDVERKALPRSGSTSSRCRGTFHCDGRLELPSVRLSLAQTQSKRSMAAGARCICSQPRTGEKPWAPDHSVSVVLVSVKWLVETSDASLQGGHARSRPAPRALPSMLLRVLARIGQTPTSESP